MEHAELSWCGLLGDLICEGKSDSYGTDERGRRVDEAHSALFDKLRAMDHERTALQRDAERYRWLREKEQGDPLFVACGGVGTWGECGHSSVSEEILDAAIDAAMKG